ncbi:MAG: helix-turn-helix transcriptional regulator, partial [Cellulomonadaceae bacterium]|nr:helix-turn-helix transcriptional regulator [Cellulomonadaceae bacterium]
MRLCYVPSVTSTGADEFGRRSADRRMLVLVREAKGWTQRELAARADVSQPTISKAENGVAELRGETLEAVAAALDCPIALLTHPVPSLGLDVSCLHH